jgi:hypothetical protein
MKKHNPLADKLLEEVILLSIQELNKKSTDTYTLQTESFASTLKKIGSTALTVAALSGPMKGRAQDSLATTSDTLSSRQYMLYAPPGTSKGTITDIDDIDRIINISSNDYKKVAEAIIEDSNYLNAFLLAVSQSFTNYTEKADLLLQMLHNTGGLTSMSEKMIEDLIFNIKSNIYVSDDNFVFLKLPKDNILIFLGKI